MKKLQYTTNDPAASTDYLAGDNTWKTIPSGGGGVPYTGATADVDLGIHSLTADSIGIGTTAGAEKLHIDGGASTTRVKIDADNGVSRILSFRTDDVQRWALRVDGAESGSNSGADFQLRRYNDAGTFIDHPIAINRSTGNITTAQNLNGATPTEMSYLSGVTSSIQTQINSKIAVSKSVLFGNFGAGSVGAGATLYAGFVKATALYSAAQAFQARTVVPIACVGKNLTVNIGAQPASGSAVLTIRVNGVDSAYTLTIAAGSATGSYQNTSSSLTLVAGDYIDIKIQNNAASSTGAVVALSMILEI
jgi:hypothetical protein